MKKQTLRAWLYLLPAILFLGFFLVYPLIDVFVYSMEEGYNFASQTYFGTGFYNYSYVLHDPYFLQAVKNTFLLVIITVPLSTGFALLISLALSSIKALRDLYQTVFFQYAGGWHGIYGAVPENRIYGRFNQPDAALVRCRTGRFYQRSLLGEDVCPVLLHDLGRYAL